MSATTWSSLKIVSFTVKLIVSLSEILSEKSGLTVFQNFLLSVIGLILMLAKYFFWSYVRDLRSNFFVYRKQFLSKNFSLPGAYYAT